MASGSSATRSRFSSRASSSSKSKSRRREKTSRTQLPSVFGCQWLPCTCRQSGQFLHELNHDGKIFVHPFCHGRGIHLLGSSSRGHGDGQIVGPTQDQAKIFVHEREGKVGWILLSLDILQLGLLARGEHGCLPQYV